MINVYNTLIPSLTYFAQRKSAYHGLLTIKKVYNFSKATSNMYIQMYTVRLYVVRLQLPEDKSPPYAYLSTGVGSTFGIRRSVSAGSSCTMVGLGSSCGAGPPDLWNVDWYGVGDASSWISDEGSS